MKVFGWHWGTFFLLAVFTINTVQSNLHDKGGEILTVDEEEVWNTYYPTQLGNSSEVNKSGKYIYWKTYFLLHFFIFYANIILWLVARFCLISKGLFFPTDASLHSCLRVAKILPKSPMICESKVDRKILPSKEDFRNFALGP